MYYNYWSAKIDFKEKIVKEVMPLMKIFIGVALTDVVLDKIKNVIAKWMSGIDDGAIFTCEIKVDVEKKSSIDVIKFINVIPLD